APATRAIHPLSLHDALPIWSTPADTARRQRGTPPARRAAPFPRFRPPAVRVGGTDARVAKPAAETPAGTAARATAAAGRAVPARSEEHTSELQSRFDLVCRL